MDIFGIAGWSGSGKTTLITALLPVFTAQGVTVATIKHTHHHPEFGGPEDLALGKRRGGKCGGVTSAVGRRA